jgi:hypothetical protein
MHMNPHSRKWSFEGGWVGLGLAAIIAAGLSIRLPGIWWLLGVGPDPEFSFHADDHRFVVGARQFDEHWPDGYVVGMTALIFLWNSIIGAFIDANALVIGRSISYFFSGVSILLVYATARELGASRAAGLIAAALLAASPIHVINSQFAMPDMTLLACVYGAFLCASHHVRTGSDNSRLIATVLGGWAIALKFFIPVVALLVTMLLLSQSRWKLTAWANAALVALGSFFAFSGFNYTVWEFTPFLKMLLFDNVVVPGGKDPLTQAVRYTADLISSLGIPSFLSFALGAALVLRRLTKATSRHAPDSTQHAIPQSRLDLRKNPHALAILLLAAPLATHIALICAAGIHAPRHILFVVPTACIIAGAGLHWLASRPRSSSMGVAMIVVVIGYSTHNAWATQSMYLNDLRHSMAEWAVRHAESGQTVATFTRYSNVSGTTIVDSENEARKSEYFLTCDIEYMRYFKENDPTQIAHGYGVGRFDFYRGLFGGRESFIVDELFLQPPTTIELRLIQSRKLPPFGMNIPRACVAFRRTKEAPLTADPRAEAATDLQKNSY